MLYLDVGFFSFVSSYPDSTEDKVGIDIALFFCLGKWDFSHCHWEWECVAVKWKKSNWKIFVCTLCL
jgi:hypothetical protein